MPSLAAVAHSEHQPRTQLGVRYGPRVLEGRNELRADREPIVLHIALEHGTVRPSRPRPGMSCLVQTKLRVEEWQNEYRRRGNIR